MDMSRSLIAIVTFFDHPAGADTVSVEWYALLVTDAYGLFLVERHDRGILPRYGPLPRSAEEGAAGA